MSIEENIQALLDANACIDDLAAASLSAARADRRERIAQNAHAAMLAHPHVKASDPAAVAAAAVSHADALIEALDAGGSA